MNEKIFEEKNSETLEEKMIKKKAGKKLHGALTEGEGSEQLTSLLRELVCIIGQGVLKGEVSLHC